MSEESWGEGLWTVQDEAKLQETLARKAAAARAEVANWDAALMDDLSWGYEQGFDRGELRQALIDNADAVCELLAPYRKVTP